MQLHLPGADLPRPLATLDWNGYSAAALFTVQVPLHWPVGQPICGTLTLGRNQQSVGKLEFAIPVDAKPPSIH